MIPTFRSVAVGLPLDCAVPPDNLRVPLGYQRGSAWRGARQRIPTSPGGPCEPLLKGSTGFAAQFDYIVPADRDWEPPLGWAWIVNRADPQARILRPMRCDPGLQPEYTALSWNRRSISMIVGGMAGPTLLSAFLGVAGIALGIAAVGAGVGLGWVSHRRAAHSLRVLLPGQGPLPDGRLLLGVAGFVSLLAAVAAVALFQLIEVG